MADLYRKQMKVFIDKGEESYNWQDLVQKLPHHQSILDEIQQSKCFQMDELNQSAPEKGQQLTNRYISNTIYEENQFLDEENRSYEEKDDKSNSPLRSSTQTNDPKPNSIKDIIQVKAPKYQKKIDKQKKGKENNCDSKNFFLFLWKKIIKRLREFQSADKDELKRVNELIEFSGSMESLNILFACQLLKDMTQKMFREKYFNRCVMISSINSDYKKKYLDFIRRVETCYRTDKRIDNLR